MENNHAKKVIEPTETSKAAFKELAHRNGGGSNPSTIELSESEILSLRAGKLLAIDDGEYTTYIKLENTTSSK